MMKNKELKDDKGKTVNLDDLQLKDEQHEQSLIDLNLKLEELQSNYDELKKRYEESIEREKIAKKIIHELRAKLNAKNNQYQKTT